MHRPAFLEFLEAEEGRRRSGPDIAEKLRSEHDGTDPFHQRHPLAYAHAADDAFPRHDEFNDASVFSVGSCVNIARV